MADHGTPSRYSNEGCRCDDCRVAWSSYLRSRRLAQLPPLDLSQFEGNWRDIPGFDGEYEVSDDGRVKSNKGIQPRLLRQSPRNGYPVVNLHHRDGAGVVTEVHRLVLRAFVGECPDGMETRHLNGDRSDNRLSNLTYGTRIENARDRMRHGTGSNQHQGKTHCKRGHSFDEKNTYRTRSGHRGCRACRSAAVRRWRAKENA